MDKDDDVTLNFGEEPVGYPACITTQTVSSCTLSNLSELICQTET
jgi:hypothetical protein